MNQEGGSRRSILEAVGLWAIYAIVLLITAHRSHFAILANDAFPLLFQAESLSFRDPRSFYNGFFPIGYPFLLRGLLLFGRQHIDAMAVLFNIAFALPLIWCLLKLMTNLGLERWWRVLAVTVALFLPEMLRGVLSIRPDHIVTVLAVAAFLSFQKKRYGLTGVLLGIACLFRAHAVALLIGFMLVALFYHDKRSWMRLLAHSIPILALQGVLNLAAGEAIMSSAQGFNIVKLIYGADWRQDQLTIPGTLEVILDHPWILAKAYFNHLLTEWYLLVPILAGLVSKRTREFAVIALLYLLAVAFGGSPRGSLPIQPIVVLIAVTLLSPSLLRTKLYRSHVLPIGVVALILVGSTFILYRFATHAGLRIGRYQDVGDRLGLSHTDQAKQVLTDDFAMYFPQIRNASPYVNGGWGLIGIPLYRERMPQFMYDDPKQLHDSLTARGVRAIVLGQPSTDQRLQATVLKDSSLFFRQHAISGYAVYRVR